MKSRRCRLAFFCRQARSASVCAIFFIIYTAASVATASPPIDTRLVFNKTMYEANITVPVTLPDSLLYSIIADTFHVKQYNAIVCGFTAISPTSYLIHASFSLLFYRCETSFKRDLLPGSGEVRVSLHSFRQNLPVLLSPDSSYGIYRIEHTNSGTYIGYHQKVWSSRRISFFYEQAIRRQMQHFGTTLAKYCFKLSNKADRRSKP